VSDDNVPPADRSDISAKEQAAKFHSKLREWIDMIFELARADGSHLTPDEAMKTLDEVLKKWSEVLAKQDLSAHDTRRPIRIDVVASLQKIHHYAVDVYYKTYFPRRGGMEGKPRRGAPRLSMEYLERIRQLSRQGRNAAQIARELGQSDPGAVDRISKQIELADRRWAEIVADYQRRGQAQFDAAALDKPKLREKRPRQRKPRTKPRSSSPK
jgi:hypothetical protein